MLHLFGSGTATRQGLFWHLSSWWTKSGIGILVVVLMATIVILVSNATDWFSGSARETPSQTSQTEQVDIAPVDNVSTVADNSPAQTESRVIEFPPLPEISPALQIEWETFVGDPGLPTTPRTRNYFGWDIPAYSSEPTEGGVAVAVHILPELQGFVQNYRNIAQGNTPSIWLNIDRDGEFIFATIFVLDDRRYQEARARGETPDSSLALKPVGYNYVLLSIDGGETWEPANQVLSEVMGKEVPTLNPVRIKAQESTLLLYQMDKPYRWWVATLDLKDLPT